MGDDYNTLTASLLVFLLVIQMITESDIKSEIHPGIVHAYLRCIHIIYEHFFFFFAVNSTGSAVKSRNSHLY